MRLRAALTQTALMLAFAGPALADSATPEGATALGKSFSAYFGESAITRGIIAVTPQGDAYQVVIDAQPALGDLPLPPDSLRIGRWTFLAAPSADGTWKISSDSFPEIGIKIPTPTGVFAESVAMNGYRLEAVYDPKIATFTSVTNSIDSIEGKAQTDAMDVDLRILGMAIDGKGSAAADGAASAEVRQSIKSMVETVEAKPGGSATPMRITYDVGASTGDSTVDAMRSRSLLDLWAFLVAEGPDGVTAHQDALKDKLRAVLPLWNSVKATAAVQDIVGHTPVGTFTMKSLTEKLGMSGMTAQGEAEFALSIDGLGIPSVLLPPWAGPFVPTGLDIDVKLTASGLDKIAAKFIDEFDLADDPPLSDDAQSELADMLMDGSPKLVIAPSHLVSKTLKLNFQGELALSMPQPSGAMTVEAEGFDESVAALQAAAKNDPRLQQGLPMLAFVKGLAKTGADGKLSWLVEYGTDGVTTVNGQRLGPPAK